MATPHTSTVWVYGHRSGTGYRVADLRTGAFRVNGTGDVAYVLSSGFARSLLP